MTNIMTRCDKGSIRKIKVLGLIVEVFCNKEVVCNLSKEQKEMSPPDIQAMNILV